MAYTHELKSEVAQPLADQQVTTSKPNQVTTGNVNVEPSSTQQLADLTAQLGTETSKPAEVASETGWTTKGGVTVPADMHATLTVIGTAYFKARNKRFVVTSGPRSAAAQADAMYNNLADGSSPSYKQKNAFDEIKKVYDDGKGKGDDRATIVTAMTATIQKQVNEGVYISSHLRSGAIDVRNSDMTAEDQTAFKKAATDAGASVLTEDDHLHVELP